MRLITNSGSRRTHSRRIAAVLAVVVAMSLAAAPSVAAPDPTIPTSVPVVGSRQVLAAQARMAWLIPQRVAAARALGKSRTGLVTDPATGSVIWSSGATTPMRGASTTKLATAVTALHVLGTSTRFPTRVVAGRTSHEIVLVAGGDPMLTSAQLRTLARSTAVALATAIPPADPSASLAAPTSVRFTVRVDDTLYPKPTYAVGWPKDYEPYVVNPVRPLVRDLRNGWDTSAEVATYFSSQVGAVLRALLAGRTDITTTVAYAGRLAAPAAAVQLAELSGNTSGAALKLMLLVSDNDIAEMLFRNNAIASGQGGSWGAASATGLAVLRGLGADVRGWALYDGSGVSRNDRVSARGLVDLLTLAMSPQHPELSPLLGWLPVAGVSGTLSASAQRFVTIPTKCARGRVFAKTGTLFDTIGLAGYSLGSDGRLRTFAMLVHSVDPAYSKLAVRHAVEVVPATATGCY